jgi:hypothetical protein
MKNKKQKLKELITEFGYWSKEVRDFNESLSSDLLLKINLNVKR